MRKKNWRTLTVAAVFAAGACGATGNDAGEHEGLLDKLAEDQRQARSEFEANITVMGGLLLSPEASLVWADDDCAPLSPDTDFMERVGELNKSPQARVLDASGDIVGTAQVTTTVTDDGACHYSFETTVPAGGNFYTVEVASFVTDAIPESEARNQELIFDLKDVL